MLKATFSSGTEAGGSGYLQQLLLHSFLWTEHHLKAFFTSKKIILPASVAGFENNKSDLNVIPFTALCGGITGRRYEVIIPVFAGN